MSRAVSVKAGAVLLGDGTTRFIDPEGELKTSTMILPCVGPGRPRESSKCQCIDCGRVVGRHTRYWECADLVLHVDCYGADVPPKHIIVPCVLRPAETALLFGGRHI